MMIPAHHQPVLLLEDQALITLYVEELLHEAGFGTIKACSSCAAAARWLDGQTPALAVIETRLRGNACSPLAATLQRRNIPFIVHSVESERDSGCPHLKHRREWLEKPCCPENFVEAARACRVRAIDPCETPRRLTVDAPVMTAPETFLSTGYFRAFMPSDPRDTVSFF